LGKIDGTGAQIQRLLSIVAFSKLLRCKFIQSDFRDVSVHPLDPFQDDASKVSFIHSMNDVFRHSGSAHIESFKSIEMNEVDLLKLISVIFRHFFSSQNLVFEVIEPYSVTDKYRNLYKEISREFTNWGTFADQFRSQNAIPTLAIHYRQGVGGEAIYPGQKISRELPAIYFYEKVLEISKRWTTEFKIRLFTDAPQGDVSYTPIREQENHWIGTPGYHQGKIHVQGNDLQAYFFGKGLTVEARVGGNPLEAIAAMSVSDFLITSRSSLSYVAGLLNENGVIFAAKDFWHATPKSWL